DSDDYLSLDFYRPMIQKAEKDQLEIVANTTILREADGSFHQYTLHKICLEEELSGEEVADTFFGQGGACYAWHTIWNKIYRKSLWDSCQADFKRLNQHIIMTEDIAFSGILFFKAGSFAGINCGAYYYCKNSEASTNTEKISWRKFEKNVKDIASVFDFLEETLERYQASSEIMTGVRNYRRRYARMWSDLYSHEFQGGEYDREAEKLIERISGKENFIAEEKACFFEWTKSKLENSLEEIRKSIADKDSKVISFDIFDTLILRTVWQPEDVFCLMQKSFEQICPEIAGYSFVTARKEAESICRRKIRESRPEWQDVTLTEIYETLQQYLDISEEQKKKLKALEENTELEVIRVRKTGKHLLDFALNMGKKIILTSDMYLERPVIERILKKCGYGKLPIFLSSEVRLVKFDEGDLFKYVAEEAGIAPEELLHIGDNWNVDILGAKKNGIKTAFLPKTKDVFCNSYKPNSTNSLSSVGNIAGNYMTTWNAMNKSIAYRSMTALAANRLFDNPFVSWNKKSDFDANPYNMGYYALGMHLAGLCVWMGSLVKEKGISRISFLARDGYLPQKAFRLLQDYLKLEHVETNYVPCSRKSLMPWMIADKRGLLNLPVKHSSHTPRSMLGLLSCCSKTIDKKALEELLFQAEIDPENCFLEKESYINFMKWFSENLFSEQKLEEEKKKVSGYYQSMIAENSFVFDLGYSGRIPAALSRSLGYPVIYGYVHGEPGSTEHYIRREGLQLYTMYDYLPPNRDLIREMFLSEPNNQCIGFKEENGEILPVLEKKEIQYSQQFVFEQLEKGAMTFIKDYLEAFGEKIEYGEINPMISSMPFEGLLVASNAVDHQVFATTNSEDLIYGNCSAISMADFWNGLSDDSSCIRKSYVFGDG
ncbi:MAG: HAD hydrolase-like protein, partial [Lachnospiraceae bacterium]|nr:HAD hydrolase-like protein [Lachnospiraceae bacterium]